MNKIDTCEIYLRNDGDLKRIKGIYTPNQAYHKAKKYEKKGFKTVIIRIDSSGKRTKVIPAELEKILDKENL